MTSTLTRPPEATSVPNGGDTASRPVPGTLLTTGDHKRLGLLFLYGGVASLLAASISGLIFFAINGGPAVWTGNQSRLSSVTTSAALIIGIPALWIGLATYVMPLQIGATRLALPRMHNLALWVYGAGGALTTVGYLADDRPINSLASSIPARAFRGNPAADVTQLIVVGLLLIGVAIFLCAVSLLTTVLNRRAEGLRLTYLPLFSWSTLATSTVLVLATPVFIAGLALLYFDLHYGGTLFGRGVAAERIWEHSLWVIGHPFGLLFAAAAVGIFGDIVSTHTGRPLVGFPAARVAAIAAPLLTLFLWAGDVSVLRSPFGPVATLGGIVVGAPLALGLLTWAGTLKQGKIRFHPSLAFAALFLANVGLATGFSIAAIFVGVEGSDADAFRNGQLSMLTFGAALLGLGGAAAHWSPKLWGRTTPTGPAMAQALLFFLGSIGVALPGYLIGLGANDSVVPIGIAGFALIAAGLGVFGLNLAARKVTSDDDPYGGHTLEWATTSPPPAHNFETIPDIRSPHPLHDARGTD